MHRWTACAHQPQAEERSARGRSPRPRSRRGGGAGARRRGCVVAALLTLLGASTALAANPTPVQLFYVPFPEGQLLQGLQAIESGGSGNTPTSPITTYVSIAAVANGTIVYYDQWENGYDADIANPANLYSGGNPGGTQIWGDGNAANGAAPGVPGDLIDAGTVIVLSNDVNTGSPLTIDFDGRDKIAATKTVAISRTGWADGSDTLLAGSVEVLDTGNWGTDYRVPVGADIPSATDHQMFEYTSLVIQAGEGGATVQIDKDADGVFESTENLGEGESVFVNGGVNVGARVTSDNPVQVDILTGDIGSSYESRDSSLLPVSLWSNSSYQPVSTVGSAATTVWLYNPGASAITVQYTTRDGGGSLTTTNLSVPGGPAGGYLPQIIPDGYGAHFATAGEAFYAFSTTDSGNVNTDGNQAWDWGFTLVPEDSLTPQVLIGLGIGRDPTSGTNPSENGNPVWVTPLGNGDAPVTVYVDYDADPATGPLTDPNGGKYDVALSLKELERAKVYDTNDDNQTGMLIYALAPGVKLAAAWGQDPTEASAGAPGLDVGTGVPPLPLFSAGKNGTLATDNDGDGFVSPGDVLLYTIAIGNFSRAPVPDLLLQDPLAPGTTYVANSTFFENAAGVVTQIPDDGVGTAFPLDGSGAVLDPISALPVGGSYVVTFKATINAFADLPPGAANVLNTCSAAAIDTTVQCQDTTPLYGRIGDFVWHDLDGDAVQDGGAEVGIAGVTVNLIVDLNGNGIVDGGDAVIASQVTDANGGYLFTGVPAGTYIVDVVDATVPAGLSLTTANDSSAVELGGGEWRLDVDFGYRSVCAPGGQPIVCDNGDACHDPGVCQPDTGTCSPPVPRADGSACDDGNACTQTDTCQSGICGGADPIQCSALDQCHAPGTCDPSSGTCSNPNAGDGTSCNDGDTCSSDDQCVAGVCQGGPGSCEVCTDQQDNDGDGLIDCLDADCPNCLPITNTCHHPCVTQIVFQRRGLDRVHLQASFKPLTPIDPGAEQVGLLITNANGVVLADLLAPGAMRRVGKSWTATVKSAKAAGGMFKIKITTLADLSYRINIRGFEEMSSSATLATMSVQLLVGDDVALATNVWSPLKTGWRVQLP